MGLGREIDHRVEPVAGQEVHDHTPVADVALDEVVPVFRLLQVKEVQAVSRIGQFVQVDDGPVRVLAEHAPDKIGADEAAPAGNK